MLGKYMVSVCTVDDCIRDMDESEPYLACIGAYVNFIGSINSAPTMRVTLAADWIQRVQSISKAAAIARRVPLQG